MKSITEPLTDQALVEDPLFGSGTDEELAELHRIWDAYAADRDTADPIVRLTLLRICRWTQEQDRLIRQHNYKDAQTLGGLIKTELEKCPSGAGLASTRLDRLVQALESAGLPLLDYGQLCAALAQKSLHAPFPYTRDMADRMLQLILQASACNDGQSLPAAQLEDLLGELAPEQG